VCSEANMENLTVTLSDTLMNLQGWFSANFLKLNLNKTDMIVFTPSLDIQPISIDPGQGELLVSGTKTKFLGVFLDCHLDWKEHIENLAPRLSRTVYLLRSLRDKAGVDLCMTAYHGYIYSILKYGIIFWGSSANVERLFILQKQCIRAIFNLKRRDSCKMYFIKSGILTLTSIYGNASCL